MEGDEEAALSGLIADRLVQQVAPGVFSGGKQIVGTKATSLPSGDQQLCFFFDDGTAMTVTGQFVVNGHQYCTVDGEEVIDGEVVDDTPELTQGT
jgi:hypothetical protein